MGQGRRRNDDIVCRERAPCFPRNESKNQRTSEKKKVVGKHRCIAIAELTTAVFFQDCASVSPSMSLVFTDPSRIVARILLSASKLILHTAQGTLVAKVDNDLASQVPQEEAPRLTKGPREIRKSSRRSSMNKSLRRRQKDNPQ